MGARAEELVRNLFNNPPSPSVSVKEALLGIDDPDDRSEAESQMSTSASGVSPHQPPSSVGEHSLAPSTSTIPDQPPAWMKQLIAGLSESRSEVKSLRAELSAMKEQQEMLTTSLKSGPVPGLPGVSELPPWDPSNPWRLGYNMPVSGDAVFVSDSMGTRAISDLEKCPKDAVFPMCWVRLRPDAPLLLDFVPKETIFLEFKRAQEHLLTFARKLEECKLTSLLLPNDSDAWNGLAATFETEKLDKDIASTQFGEALPALTPQLIAAEAEAKRKLAPLLSVQTFLEASMAKSPDDMNAKVLSKMLLSSLYDALTNFFKARRACWQHIFAGSKVPHEPRSLTNSCIWGKDLFPEEVVVESVKRATERNESLFEKWGLSSSKGGKRESSAGPSKSKKPRHSPGFHGHASFPVPTPSGVPRFNLVSPASIPRYESQGTTTFRPYSFKGKGGGSGFSKGDKGHSGQAARDDSRRNRKGKGGQGHGHSSGSGASTSAQK